MAARLIATEVAYGASCCTYVAELAEADEIPVPFTLHLSLDNFAGYVQRLSVWAHRSPRFVPNGTFWLVEGEQLITAAHHRHYLNRRLR